MKSQLSPQKNELIQLLNDVLSDEQAAAIQYYQGANCLLSWIALSADEFITHGDEEAGHAKELREHLDYLGGYITTMTAEITTSDINIETLKLMYKAEINAITKYKNLVRFCRESGFYETEYLALRILKDEVHHATYLKNIIGNEGVI